MTPERIPERIGKYPVERLLGGGGMGKLYLARHPDLGHQVAIKTLRADYQDDPDLRERFLREARSAAQLAHPNIVKVHDFVADETQPFIVMEFIDGDTLGKRLRIPPSLTLEQTLTLFDELCSGLAHAHAAGIVHRDIKPANLMLDSRGVLRILDFGIARLGNSGMTLEGQVMGSVNYMPPEQVAGRGVDHRSDIFAAGAVMYEVLTLEKAFPGETYAEALNRILNQNPTPITQQSPEIDPELAAIVERALQKDVEARYRSADDMRRDLTRVRRRLLRRDSGATVIRGPEDPGRVDPQRLAELKNQQLAENLQAGAAAFARRHFDEARRFAERALAVDPADHAALDLYDQSRFAVQAAAVRERLDQVVRHLADGRIAEAEAALGDTSVTLPNLPEATALRKEIREVSERVSAAIEREQRIRVSLGRARASMEQGGYDTALRAIYEVLSLDPDRAEARELESNAKAGLQTKRDRERVERAARAEVRRARDLIANSLFDEASAVLSAIVAPSDAVRADVADAQAALERAREVARVSAVLTSAREALAREQFDDVLATLAALDAKDPVPEADALRTSARQGIERARELERKRGILNAGIVAVQQLLDGKDLAGALERLEAIAALGLPDERIGALRRRIADLGAQEHQRRLQEARDRQAERRVATAHQLLALGQEREALALLERDDVDHPAVQSALLQIRDEVARRAHAREQEEERRLAEEERRRGEEERRRREEEARLAAAAAEARRLEEARAAEARRLEEARAAEARQIEEARTAARQREEAELRRQEAERLRREEEARRLHEEEAQRLAEAERQRRVEAERRREEEERRREEAVTLVVTRMNRVVDDAAALAELRDAATIAPNDPRIVTLIRQREDAIEAKAAAERARVAEENAAREREAQRLRDAAAAQVNEQARRQFTAGQHQEALDLLRAAVAHPAVSATIARLEKELDEIERTRAAEEAAAREREAQRQRDAAAAEVNDQARRLFTAGQHQEALGLLRAAAAHPTVSAAIASLEGEFKEIERARAAVERRVRRAAALGKVKSAIADRRVQAVAALLVVGVVVALVLSRQPPIDIAREDRSAAAERAAEEAKQVAERVEAERAAADAKRAADERAAEEAKQVPAERVEAERAAADAKRVAEERAAAEEKRLAAERAAADAKRVAEERAAAEEKRLATERAAAEAKRVAEERAAAETKRLAAERAAAEEKRLAAERAAAEAKRLAAEREAAEVKRLAAERASAGAAIDGLLERYVQAYESLDEGRIRQIDPGFNHFDPRTKPLLKALQVRITGRAVTVAADGQTARVTATQNVTYDWQRAALQKTATIPLAWNLRKEGSEWRVVR